MYPSNIAIIITSCLAIIACAAPANNPESPPNLTERGLQKDGNTNAGIASKQVMERGIFGGKSKKKDDKKDKKKDKGQGGEEEGKKSYYKATTAAEFCAAYTCANSYDESCRYISGQLLNLEQVTCGTCAEFTDGSYRCAP